MSAPAGDQLAALHRHRAADRRPLADAVALGAQVAAHLQQPAGGVPALAFIAVHALGHLHQRAAVDPDFTVVQDLAIAVERRVAQFVALDIDLEVVGFHRHLDADRAGDVQQRTVVEQRAAIGRDGDLPPWPAPARRPGPRPCRRWSPRCATGRGDRARRSGDRKPGPRSDDCRPPPALDAPACRAAHPARRCRRSRSGWRWWNPGRTRRCRWRRWPNSADAPCRAWSPTWWRWPRPAGGPRVRSA